MDKFPAAFFLDGIDVLQVGTELLIICGVLRDATPPDPPPPVPPTIIETAAANDITNATMVTLKAIAETGTANDSVDGTVIPAPPSGPAFVWANNSDTLTSNTGNSFTVGSTNPASTNGTINSGDFLLAMVVVAAFSDPGSITLSGFTSLFSFYDASSFYRVQIGWKTAGGAESGTYAASWTSTGNVGASWLLANFSGVNATPIDASSQSQNDSPATNMLATAISPSGSTDLLVGLWGGVGGNGPYAADPSMTQRANVAATAASIVEILMATEQLSASGSTGSRTATQTNPSISGGFLIALSP